MKTHPFEDDEAIYFVLSNSVGEYSLWPAAMTPPPGWRVVLAESDRATCLRYVETHWITKL